MSDGKPPLLPHPADDFRVHGQGTWLTAQCSEPSHHLNDFELCYQVIIVHCVYCWLKKTTVKVDFLVLRPVCRDKYSAATAIRQSFYTNSWMDFDRNQWIRVDYPKANFPNFYLKSTT
jgi:hypothetical protein